MADPPMTSPENQNGRVSPRPTSTLIPFIIYIKAKQLEPRDPHSAVKRRWLQLMLLVHEIFFWWLPMAPIGLRILYSYFWGHSGKFLKNITYTMPGHLQKPRHHLDVYPQYGGELAPVLVFIHGGAWGFNSKFDHHLCDPLTKASGFVVVIPNYSRYPFGHIEDMIDDADQVFEWTVKNISKYGGNTQRMMLAGHSAGAHIITMTLFENLFRTKGRTLFVERPPKSTTWTGTTFRTALLLSGVYDINDHYDYEASRAVEDLSPMKPAMRGYQNFSQYSPTGILRYMSQSYEVEKILHEFKSLLPELHVIHAEPDFTVPSLSSINFYEAMRSLEIQKTSLTLMSSIGHADFALGLMGSSGEKHIVPLFQEYFQRMCS